MVQLERSMVSVFSFLNSLKSLQIQVPSFHTLFPLQGLTWAPLPFIVYGACSIMAGIISCFLPETLNRRLPETLEDVENFHRLDCVESKRIYFTSNLLQSKKSFFVKIM